MIQSNYLKEFIILLPVVFLTIELLVFLKVWDRVKKVNKLTRELLKFLRVNNMDDESKEKEFISKALGSVVQSGLLLLVLLFSILFLFFAGFAAGFFIFEDNMQLIREYFKLNFQIFMIVSSVVYLFLRNKILNFKTVYHEKN